MKIASRCTALMIVTLFVATSHAQRDSVTLLDPEDAKNEHYRAMIEQVHEGTFNPMRHEGTDENSFMRMLYWGQSNSNRFSGQATFGEEEVPFVSPSAWDIPGLIISMHTENDRESIKVQFSGSSPVSVPLVQVIDATLAQTINYAAEIKSLRGDSDKYIEMLCTVDGNTYFSRDVNGSLTGETAWLRRSTPFYFSGDNRAERVTLGLRFEGPGAVLIRNLFLSNDDSIIAQWGLSGGAVGGILGAAVGITAGLFGAFAGIMVPKGKGKRLVMGSMIGLIASGAVLFLVGLYLWITQGLWTGYPFLLCGFLLVAVFIPQFFTVRYAYQNAEMRKMEAKNIV